MAKKKNDIEVNVGAKTDDFIKDIRALVAEVSKLNNALNKTGAKSSGDVAGIDKGLIKTADTAIGKIKTLKGELKGVKAPKVSFANFNKSLTSAIAKVKTLQKEIAKIGAVQLPKTSAEETVVDVPIARSQRKKRTVKPSSIVNPVFEAALAAEPTAQPKEEKDKILEQARKEEFQQRKLIKDTDHAANVQALKEEFQQREANRKAEEKAQKDLDKIGAQARKEEFQQREANRKAEEKAQKDLDKIGAQARKEEFQQREANRKAEEKAQKDLDKIVAQARKEEFQQREANRKAEEKAQKDLDKIGAQARKEEFQQREANRKAEEKAQKDLKKITDSALTDEFKQREANRKVEEKALKGLAKLRRDAEIASEVGKPLGHAAYLRKQDAEKMYREQLRNIGVTDIPKATFAKPYGRYLQTFNVDVDTSKAKTKVENLRKYVGKPMRQQVAVNVDDRNASASIKRIFSWLKGLRSQTVTVDVKGKSGGKDKSLFDTLKRLPALARKAVVELNVVGTAISMLGQRIADVAHEIVGLGFDFNRNMETAQTGIAGIITSMGQLDGKAISFKQALGMSETIFDALHKDAILTAASTEDLVKTFQGILAPGLGAGLKIDEIRRFTTTGVNMAKAMGLDNTQYIQELRDLLQGGIQPASSTIATALGLTDADIKKAKASTDGLFKFLMDRMSGAQAMAEHFPKTINGMLDQIKEFSVLASKAIVDDFMGEIQYVLKEVRDWFGTFNKETGEFEVNDTVKELTQSLKDLYIWVLEVIDYWTNFYNRVSKQTSFKIIIDLLSFFGDLLERTIDLLGTAAEFAVSFFNVLENGSLVGPILRGLERAIRGLGDAIIWVFDTAIAMYRKSIAVLDAEADRRQGVAVGSTNYDSGASRLAEQAKLRMQEEASKRALTKQRKDHPEWFGLPSKDAQAKQVNSVTSKFPNKTDEKANKDRLKTLKDALNRQNEIIKRHLKQILEAIKESLEKDELLYKQSEIGLAEYLQRKAQADVDKAKAEVDAVQKQIQATKTSGSFETPKELEQALEKLGWELEDATRAFDKAVAAQEGVARQIGHYSKVNPITPYLDALRKLQGQSATSTNTTPTVGVSKESVAAAYKPWVGQQMKNLEVGCVEAVTKMGAGFNTILKDAVDRVIVNVNDLIDFARAKGVSLIPYDPKDVKAGDVVVYNKNGMSPDYTDRGSLRNVHVALATDDEGNGADNSSSGATKIVERAIERTWQKAVYILKTSVTGVPQQLLGGAGNSLLPGMQDLLATTVAEYDAKQQLEKLKQSIQDFNGQFDDLFGDTARLRIEKVTEEIQKAVKEMRANGANETADKLETILAAKVVDLNVEESKGRIDVALQTIEDNLRTTGYKITAGLNSYSDVISNYANRFMGGNAPHGDFDLKANLDRLYGELKEATRRGFKSRILSIKQQISAIYDHIIKSIQDIVAKIEELFDWEDSIIDSRIDMSSGQKERAHGVVASRRYATKADENNRIADAIRQEALRRQETGDISDEDFRGLESLAKHYKRAALLNSELAKIPTLLEKVHSTAQQALEDGLNTFLTDGINNAESLGDALRDLATGILKELQSLFAKEITADIMDRVYGKDIDRGTERMQEELDEGSLVEGLSEFTNTLDTRIAGEVEVLGRMDATLLRIENSLLGLNPNKEVPTSMDDTGETPNESVDLEVGTQSFEATLNNTGSVIANTIMNLATQSSTLMQELTSTLGMSIQQLINMLLSAIAQAQSANDTSTGFATGGYVTGAGTSTSDSIPAMLSNGEFVINAKAVKQMGLDALHRINNGTFNNIRVNVPKFAGGGLVGDAGSAVAEKFGFVSSQPVINTSTTVKNYVDGKRVFDTYGRDMVRTEVSKQMVTNAKVNSLLSKRF